MSKLPYTRAAHVDQGNLEPDGLALRDGLRGPGVRCVLHRTRGEKELDVGLAVEHRRVLHEGHRLPRELRHPGARARGRVEP